MQDFIEFIVNDNTITCELKQNFNEDSRYTCLGHFSRKQTSLLYQELIKRANGLISNFQNAILTAKVKKRV